MNLIDYNVSTFKNTIYDNLDYICKELNINIKTTGIELIREIICSFDFDKNVYKININTSEFKIKIVQRLKKVSSITDS